MSTTFDCTLCGRVFRRRVNLTAHRLICANADAGFLSPQFNFEEVQHQLEEIEDTEGFLQDKDHGQPSMTLQSEGMQTAHHQASVDHFLENNEDEDSDEILEDINNTKPIRSVDLHDLGLDSSLLYFSSNDTNLLENNGADLVLTKDQYRAAMFILTCGASDVGLSIKITDEYLRSLPDGCEAVQKWKNAKTFWDDHAWRQHKALAMTGKWKKIEISPPHGDIPTYTAMVRDLPKTVINIINTSVQIEDTNWENDLNLVSSIQTNARGQRILHKFQSADDLNYVHRALRCNQVHRHTLFVPLQLFIDKANVTRLNKKSMYPVILYILCFSRRVRRRLAVNVAFIPVVNDFAKNEKRLHKDVAKLGRAHAIQKTLQSLLVPLTADAALQAHYPNGTERSFIPFLFSIVADLPEVAVLLCMKYGLKTKLPCFRCFVPKTGLTDLQLDAKLKTAEYFQQASIQIEALRTKTLKNEHLKSLSLRLPESFLLSRFEMGLDSAAKRKSPMTRIFIPSNSIHMGYTPFPASRQCIIWIWD